MVGCKSNLELIFDQTPDTPVVTLKGAVSIKNLGGQGTIGEPYLLSVDEGAQGALIELKIVDNNPKSAAQ